MNTSKRRYDGKHRVTRILLADYLLLKDYCQKTGESMAEALHTIITRDWAMAHKAEPVSQPVSQPVFRVTAPVVLRHKPSTSIATNGGIMPAFRIKTKGVRYA
ncbi:hypothetical protein ES703_106833 [subsurface metagenome]